MISTTTKFEKNKTAFLICDCGSEILYIDYDHEIKMADFAIFNHSMYLGTTKSLWQRIRYAFRVLIGKSQYADQMMLTKDQLRELKLFLQSIE